MNVENIVAQLYQQLKQYLVENRFYITGHAREQALNRGIVAPIQRLKEAVTKEEAKIIQLLWEYPMDCLKIKVFIPGSGFVHYGIMIKENQMGIATIYLPTEYEEDGKTRKRN